MHTEIFRNKDVYGDSSRPMRTMIGWVGGGVVIMLVVLAAVMIEGLVQLGVLEPSPLTRGGKSNPFWGNVLLVLVLLGVGIFSIQHGIALYRQALEARRTVDSGQGLKSAEGPPRFMRDSEYQNSLFRLTCGHKEFDLLNARGVITNTEDYKWGESTGIRGEIRAWYVPASGLLVYAEWRPYNADEIAQRLDAILAENKNWTPNIPSILDKSAGNPKIMAEAQQVVNKFQELINEDCRKLEELSHTLFPGTPIDERRKAEEEFNTITARINLNKGAVISALKTAKKLGY